MDNNTLSEMQNKISVLPVLEQRMKELRNKIYTAEEDVKSLLRKFEIESLDVEQIQKDSFSNTILKFIGKYEGKLNKEVQEMLTAKMDYDRAAERVKELNLERIELGLKIADLNKQKLAFEDEYKRREELIKSKTSWQVYMNYVDLQNEQDSLSGQILETDEAIRAANKVLNTADRAIVHLDKAESWATYDVWAKGGVFSHMAKYDHIDDAQKAFNRLKSQIQDFEKELRDINFYASYPSIGIDSTTRAVDFWFDNIFTDLNVRNKIREDREQLRSLCSKIGRVVSQLENKKAEFQNKINELENRKKELVLSLDI